MTAANATGTKPNDILCQEPTWEFKYIPFQVFSTKFGFYKFKYVLTKNSQTKNQMYSDVIKLLFIQDVLIAIQDRTQIGRNY